MKKHFLIVLLCLLAAGGFTTVFAADQDAAMADKAVREYEGRLDSLGKEIEAVRQELDRVTKDLVEGETGQTYIFLKGKASDWRDRGVGVMIDGKKLFGRFLGPAELNVLAGGLPLQLLELRLTAGMHKFALYPVDDQNPRSVELMVKRAETNSWVVEFSGGSYQWNAE